MFGLFKRKEREDPMYKKRREFLANGTSEQQRVTIAQLGSPSSLVNDTAEYLQGSEGHVDIGVYDGFLDFDIVATIDLAGQVQIKYPEDNSLDSMAAVIIPACALRKSLQDRGIPYRENISSHKLKEEVRKSVESERSMHIEALEQLIGP